ncbi:MAG: RIP metalloprotease RseP [Clostridia bacterium]|nr:RIP metalloprotease RseP [Clostridia bacterium]
MDTVLSILAALVVLSILVVIHELGHYWAGRLLGFRIVEFAVGMGPRIFKFERKGTIYALRAFPIGGMCQFDGEDEEESEGSFNAQPVWKRMIVVLAGPLMNFVLALVIAAITLLAFGGDYQYDVPPVVQSVSEDSPAELAGIEAGDVILSVDGYAVDNYDAITPAILEANTTRAIVVLSRGGVEITTWVENIFDAEEGRNLLGITISPQREQLGFFAACSRSVSYTADLVKQMFGFLGSLFTGDVDGDDVAGPVGTIQIIGQAVRAGFEVVLMIAVIMSVNLGFINLLPLPALDGGRFVFMVIEAIIRRPISRKVEAIVHFAGFVLLIGLMLLLTFNDISRILAG